MKDKKKIVLFVSVVLIMVFLVGLFWIGSSFYDTLNKLSKDKKYPEVIYKEMISPYKDFKIIITHYETSWPTGIKGFIYISDLDGIKKKKVINFCEDFLGDTSVEWDENKKGFCYIDKIINLKEYPLK